MPKCLFEKASGLYEGGTSFDDLDHDPATHIQLTMAAYPDRRTRRWNGSTGTRAATAQELSDFDDAANDGKAASALDTPVNIVLRDMLWAIVVELRAAGRDLDTIPELTAANAPDKASFTAALKTLVKAKQ